MIRENEGQAHKCYGFNYRTFMACICESKVKQMKEKTITWL